MSRRPSSQQPKGGRGRGERGNNLGPVWSNGAGARQQVRLGAVGPVRARRRPRPAPWAPWGPPGARQVTRAGRPSGHAAQVGPGVGVRRRIRGLEDSPLSSGKGSKGTKKGPNRKDAPGLARTDGRPIFRGKTGAGIWFRGMAGPSLAASIPAASKQQRAPWRQQGATGFCFHHHGYQLTAPASSPSTIARRARVTRSRSGRWMQRAASPRPPRRHPA